MGVDNPEAWLDAQTDENLAMWQAYHNIEPLDTGWERHAEIMAMLDGLSAAMINPNIPSDKKHLMHTPRPPIDFLPSRYGPKKEVVPIEKQLDLVAKAMGGKRGNNNK